MATRLLEAGVARTAVRLRQFERLESHVRALKCGVHKTLAQEKPESTPHRSFESEHQEGESSCANGSGDVEEPDAASMLPSKSAAPNGMHDGGAGSDVIASDDGIHAMDTS